MINAQMMPSMLPMGGSSLNLDDAANFDGVNDYLSRTSDLTGNASSSAFTISFWVKLDSLTDYPTVYSGRDAPSSGNYGIIVQFRSDEHVFNIVGANASGTFILNMRTNATAMLAGQWYHVLISFDLSSSSLRHAYINDVIDSPYWGVYTAGTINFNKAYHIVGSAPGGASKIDGQMACLFIDRTYRDLSVEANRRLFNDGAGAPTAGQELLNPILYLPLLSGTPWGDNLGTGGDFTVNGDLT